MSYIIQHSILKYLLNSKLITIDEFTETDKILKAESKKNKEISQKVLTNENIGDILLTVDKNSEENRRKF